ncbi:DUF2069 domain-containing protein [Microbulbifer sp. THAF38]|uniref:DUF2069 domain-containing protein n=1 Tax=Microbulbifer sp. THAF38 TaxID=2587856 RepID=UPI001268D297|nr:DUF2069 domain-containing protein [Microbulbifer sp. THAF38]QFT55759.1 hypothetical protein FIU95_14510 [Microbulbifer sp. THAF38]
MNDTIQRKLHIALRINWFCYIALLVLIAARNLFIEGGSLALWLIQTVPLLLVLPGLIKQRYRSYLWLCFILLLYITTSIVDVMMPTRGWQDGAMVVLSLILFFSAMMSSRWHRMQ